MHRNTRHDTIVYFIRHAESDISVHDDLTRPLTAKGHHDARQLLHVFQSVTIDHFYSSPYVRAAETLLYLAESRNKQVVLHPDLRERAIGCWVDDFFSYAQRQWEDFQYTLEHGESLHAVQSRNIAVLDHVLTAHARKTVLVGTHGTALGTIRHYFDPLFGFEQFWAMVNIMPFIVKMVFEESMLKSLKEVPIPSI
jgi:2,3-bisphosphoglycerate-dependent phosphoglycerate mutase